MSLASAYAASIAGVQSGAPAGFTGPGGLMVAKVDENGNCQMTINGTQYTVPGAAVLSFATWANTTFT
jgi:hypothetical protein